MSELRDLSTQEPPPTTSWTSARVAEMERIEDRLVRPQQIGHIVKAETQGK